MTLNMYWSYAPDTSADVWQKAVTDIFIKTKVRGFWEQKMHQNNISFQKEYEALFRHIKVFSREG